MLLPLYVAGQTVAGVVTDARNGSALEYVNVGVPGTSIGTTTDHAGRYRLDISPASKTPGTDSVTIRFSFTGYRPAEHRVASAATIDVALQPLAHQLEQVEVRDDKNRQTAFTPIEVQKLDDAVGPSGGVEAIIKMLPDVSSNNELSSQYSVRGGSFDENLVYINDVEIFRPMLVRNAQQEGMSIINPDLVDYILFSPGGFNATYGDRMSSVLDITYSRPREFRGKVSASLLGASASVQGMAWDKLGYAVGFRHHNNGYVLGSLDTKGSYTTSYTDVQSLLTYDVSERLQLRALGLWTNNVYGLVPESQTTTFGGFYMPMVIRIYFDGQEMDQSGTLLGAFAADWRPNDDWHLCGTVSAQHTTERERYDVQSQYFLYELAMGETAGDTAMFDRGVGTFLEHARNRLSTDIYAAELRASRYARLGSWDFGIKMQVERVDDHLREWRWLDSAGFALPSNILPLGDSSNMPQSPILQRYVNSNSSLATLRGSAFVQRELNFTTRHNSDIQVFVGLRGTLYNSEMESNGVGGSTGLRAMFGPRLSAAYKPNVKEDVLFKLAAGIYNQAPFYREYRRTDGQLVPQVDPQTSYQVMGTADWRFRMWNKPFTLTTDIYYKYITNLVPYTIDNLRISYIPDESAVAYATGVSLRFNGELVKGLETWASLSLMKTQEDIAGDGLGWLDRPTDQRLSFKLFIQDNLPRMPWWRMSLQMIFGTGTPVTVPMIARSEESYRLPSYYRVDWGNTVQLSEFAGLKNWKLFKVVDDIQVGVEVFNLFDFRNVISYLWVADYQNHYFPVPNYLTARQLNFKLTVLF